MFGGPLLAQCGAVAAEVATIIRSAGRTTNVPDLRGAYLLLQQVYPTEGRATAANCRSAVAKDSVKGS